MLDLWNIISDTLDEAKLSVTCLKQNKLYSSQKVSLCDEALCNINLKGPTCILTWGYISISLWSIKYADQNYLYIITVMKRYYQYKKYATH